MKKTLFLTVASLMLATVFHAQNNEISGTYYVGEPNYDKNLEHPWKRTFESVEITYNAENATIELVYDNNQRSMKGSPSSSVLDAVKKGTLYAFEMSNVGPNCLTNVGLLQIEPGIFVVRPATSSDLGCTTIKRPAKSNAPAKGGKVYPVEGLVREFILGKDQARINQLIADQSLYEKLVADAVLKKCKAIAGTSAANNPLPSKGDLDASEGKTANELIQKWSVTKNWPQKVKRSFVTSNDWTIKRNAKGEIVYRSITCVVVMIQNGSCSWKEYYVHQDYNGSAYGKSYVYGEGQGQYATDCQ